MSKRQLSSLEELDQAMWGLLIGVVLIVICFAGFLGWIAYSNRNNPPPPVIERSCPNPEHKVFYAKSGGYFCAPKAIEKEVRP